MSSLGNWNPTKLPKNDGKSNTVKSWSQPRSTSNSHPSPPPPPPPLDHNLSSIRNVRSFALSSHTTSLTLNLPRLVKILFEIFLKFDLWMNFFNFFGIRMVRLSSLSIFFSTHLFHFSFDDFAVWYEMYFTGFVFLAWDPVKSILQCDWFGLLEQTETHLISITFWDFFYWIKRFGWSKLWFPTFIP